MCVARDSPKFFRASVYRVYRAVIFAIARLSCYNINVNPLFPLADGYSISENLFVHHKSIAIFVMIKIYRKVNSERLSALDILSSARH